MGMTRLGDIKGGSTKDMVVALFVNANPKVTEVMSQSEIKKATLSDMLLARAASMMLYHNSKSTIVDSLNANIKSITASSTKIPPMLAKQSEDIQGKYNTFDTMRKSLERQMMEYANTRKAKMQEIIRGVLDGTIKDKNVARNQLKALDDETKHLQTKIEAVYKELNTIQSAQTKTLEDFYKTIPGKNLAELQKILKPEEGTPRPE